MRERAHYQDCTAPKQCVIEIEHCLADIAISIALLWPKQSIFDSIIVTSLKLWFICILTVTLSNKCK